MYTRAKKNGRKVMAGGENRMMQPTAPRWGQVAQVDRFVRGRSGTGYNPYSSKKPRCTNYNGKGTIICGICYGSCTTTAPTDSPTTPYVATLPAPLVVTAVIDAATAGYPSGAATAFRDS